MNRTLCSLALALLIVVGLSAAADARPVKFRVQIKASQTTAWDMPVQQNGGDCYNRPYRKADGREVVKFKGSDVAYADRIGNSVFFSYGSPEFGPSGRNGIKLRATLDRESTSRYGALPGPCGGGRPEEVIPTDCDSRVADAFGQLSWADARRRKLQLRASIPDPSSFLFSRCPVHVAGGVRAAGLTEITQNAPARELLDPDFKKHIVIARKTFSGTLFPDTAPINTTTNVFWRVTLRRLR